MVKEYEYFKQEILALTKIDLNAYKERQMKRRLDSLILKNGFKDYESYLFALKTESKLFNEFVTYITINVSEFFRNPSQWKVLEIHILPYLFENFGNRLTIWSAACASGDEPYSLAMLLSNYVPLDHIKIIATDIDEQILKKARNGLYNEKTIAAIPKEYQQRFFEKVDNQYQVVQEIRKCIEFKKHDLLRDAYPGQVNLIICRNVLIYFTEDAKDHIYQKFNKALCVKGMLFVGSTEQIIRSKQYNFSSEHTFFYKKEADISLKNF